MALLTMLWLTREALMQAAITLSYYSTLCAPAKKSFKTPEPYFTLPKHFTSRKKKSEDVGVELSVCS